MVLKTIELDPALYQRTKLLEKRSGTGLSSSFELLEEIGRGSNNRVFKALHKESNQVVVVRYPRRKSDTERAGYASWEFRHTLMASNLGIAPEMYDAWYVRHATTKQKSGLHMVTEYLPHDGQEIYSTFLMENVLENKAEMEENIINNIKKMADIGMLCYDLKPGNMVVDFEDFNVKFIDFGREFCEYSTWDMNSEERTPVTSYIKKICVTNTKTDNEAKQMYHYLLFLTMIVLLSSNTAYYISSVKEKSNIDKQLRETLNVIAPYTKQLLDGTKGKIIRFLKKILRQEDIRATCRHYMSRRNSGTKRIINWATGQLI